MRAAHAKALGAFYTDAPVAEFLVRWAVQDAADTVLDPSFGGGVFLEAAAARLQGLGGEGARQIYGVELDAAVHAHVSQGLALAPGNLLRADFFAVDPGTLPPLSAVVGNPPFVRYQAFDSTRAAARAAAQGVTLTKLSSSWAAFVVHGAAFLKPGGRLALVIPSELTHAAYARPVLAYLTRAFGRVTLLTFRTRLFPQLSQDTLLLLAEGQGDAFEGLFWRDADDLGTLRKATHTRLAATERLPETELLSGRAKLSSYFIPTPARELYRELSQHQETFRLGALADIGSGYVTGANSFFQLSPAQAEALSLPPANLRPAVFRSAALSGLTFGEADWRRGSQQGQAGYLLQVTGEAPRDELGGELSAYLTQGEAANVHEAYKCRVRTPWYRVPHVYQPDALLTYMSGLRPQLVANTCGAVAPNTLHGVQLESGSTLSPTDLAALWQTSLTRLSAELEGHALGGGMLKLEPGEARRVLVASGRPQAEAVETLDEHLRQGHSGEAQHLADQTFLQDGLGLTARECTILREAAQLLQERRYYQGRARAAPGKSLASPARPPAN